MAAICWFYKMTPTEYRALKIKDFDELLRFMNEYYNAKKPKKR